MKSIYEYRKINHVYLCMAIFILYYFILKSFHCSRTDPGKLLFLLMQMLVISKLVIGPCPWCIENFQASSHSSYVHCVQYMQICGLHQWEDFTYVFMSEWMRNGVVMGCYKEGSCYWGNCSLRDKFEVGMVPAVELIWLVTGRKCALLVLEL